MATAHSTVAVSRGKVPGQLSTKFLFWKKWMRKLNSCCMWQRQWCFIAAFHSAYTARVS